MGEEITPWDGVEGRIKEVLKEFCWKGVRSGEMVKEIRMFAPSPGGGYCGDPAETDADPIRGL